MESANSDSLGAVLADACSAAEGQIGTDPGVENPVSGAHRPLTL
jgi:hypothetical protein